MALYSRHSLSLFFTKLPLTERTTLFTIDNHSDKQVTVTTHFTNPNTGEEVGEYSYIVFCQGAHLGSDGYPVLTSPWKFVGHCVTYRLNDDGTEITPLALLTPRHEESLIEEPLGGVE